MEGIKALGHKVTGYMGLETFPTPKGLSRVTMVSDEVTAVCPVTGQPDWYVVSITYTPATVCIESKTLKLYLHSLRSEGEFCEALAVRIRKEIATAVKTEAVQVTITQKPRGGISIVAVAGGGL